MATHMATHVASHVASHMTSHMTSHMEGLVTMGAMLSGANGIGYSCPDGWRDSARRECGLDGARVWRQERRGGGALRLGGELSELGRAVLRLAGCVTAVRVNVRPRFALCDTSCMYTVDMQCSAG